MIANVANGRGAGRGAGAGAGANRYRSRSINPFVPPKEMLLPASSNVTVTVNVGEVSTDPLSGAGASVPIKLTATATALYVVLTTAANGRFSDNALLLEAGVPTAVEFIGWSAVDAAALALLKSTLRVEHLAENLS